MVKSDEIEKKLWSTSGCYNQDNDSRREIVFEQYKLCLSMADKISERRTAANSFFLTFHTASIGVITALTGTKQITIEPFMAIAFFTASLLCCAVWALLLRSYRNLNSAKFQVIGLLERTLPASPFYAAEWSALGKGKDWKKYIPLGAIEIYVPLVYAALYIYALVLCFIGF